MSIIYDDKEKIFLINTIETTYAIGIMGQYLVHLYWGKRISGKFSINDIMPYVSRPYASIFRKDVNPYSNECLPMEYPAFGSCDPRYPAIEIDYGDGNFLNLEYTGYIIYRGKHKIDSLPSSFGTENEVTTLEIELTDKTKNTQVVLMYSVFEEMNVITRSVKINNLGTEDIIVDKVLSASVDFFENDFQMISLSGAWARERHIEKIDLHHGNTMIESRRGASSHQLNPFIALARKGATETYGDVFSMNFVYSGNFVAGAEVDHYQMTRMYMGINPFNFSWKLSPGKVFQSPEVIMVYSDEGLGKMSRVYHDFFREHICKSKYSKKVRPILINNWEATYYDFNEEKLIKLAKKAKEIGVEMIVLDDGWFGERNDPSSSLGDWYVNKSKLPNGIDGLAKKIDEIDMKFGIWVEPEMISEKSVLFGKHPDWVMGSCSEYISEGRNQYILDLSNPEVCEYIIDVLSDLFSSAKISYVKWDMNRSMNEVNSRYIDNDRQKEVAHRYILGLYYILDTLTERFPNILFEGCAGGGGRFDAGMLYYMPQIWTSDCTDAIERLYIQYGTSLVYPALSMGAHVSVVPNHQLGRTTSIETRINVALLGQFGLELDVEKCSDEELSHLRKGIAKYKELREIIQFGDMYRLCSPFDSNSASWEFISKDKKDILVFNFCIFTNANPKFSFLHLQGLEEDAIYYDEEHNIKLSGSVLMRNGISLLNTEDYKSEMLHFKMI